MYLYIDPIILNVNKTINLFLKPQKNVKSIFDEDVRIIFC